MADRADIKDQRVLMSLLADLQQAKARIEDQARALQETNQKLKAANIMKDEFVAKVSHELRTPLTSIKEGLSLVLDGALGPTTAEQQDFLKTMDGDIDRLTELINSVLDIAKIEAGRMHLAREQVNLKELIDSIIRSYQPIIGHRKVQTVLQEVPPVFADSHRIRQVFSNLFANALKFTQDSGSILFRIQRQDGMVSVSVEDDGPGIAKEDIPKLFQKFSQVGHSGPQRAKGTGLGLTVCKELTELHQGTIQVSSVPNQGSVFTVSLPVYTESLVLQEALGDLIRLTVDEQQPIALLAIAASDAASLELLKRQVRAHVHRDDRVLTRTPGWVLVLAITDAAGLRAMARRLADILPDGKTITMGAALCNREAPVAEPFFLEATSLRGKAFIHEVV